MKYEVEENIIMWAFRYALGRRTGAVESVIRCLFDNWKIITENTRNQIIDEIKIAIDRDEAGSQCDINNWQRVKDFNLYVKSKGK